MREREFSIDLQPETSHSPSIYNHYLFSECFYSRHDRVNIYRLWHKFYADPVDQNVANFEAIVKHITPRVDNFIYPRSMCNEIDS